MAITIADVVKVLKNCVDPEVGVNIVDLGLVYGIKIDGNNIKVTLTMTSPMCPLTSIILADAELRLKAIEGVGDVEIELVWDPPWSPEMMSEEVRNQLNV